MGPSWLQILVVAVLVLLLFGRGKIASLMKEVAQGIKGFRKGLEEPMEESPPRSVEERRSEEAVSVKSETPSDSEKH